VETASHRHPERSRGISSFAGDKARDASTRSA
jgi:hypothetical protein